MKTHLKGLDTLRAIAALIVVWSHIEILKPIHEIGVSLSYFPNAHFSVVLFFVLSGFLITYLLVSEKVKTDSISFKKFYSRRILRIWPVYYAVLIVSYFAISSNVPLRTILLCATIFPNIPFALKSGWEGSPQISTVGVEEQFYLFWPLIIMFVPFRYLKISIVLFILFYISLPFLINYANEIFFESEKLFSFTQKFFSITKFSCMAIGSFLGVLFAEKNKFLGLFYSSFRLSLFYVLFPLLIWMCNLKFGYFTDEVYALLFAMLVITVVCNPFFNIDNKLTESHTDCICITGLSSACFSGRFSHIRYYIRLGLYILLHLVFQQ